MFFHLQSYRKKLIKFGMIIAQNNLNHKQQCKQLEFSI